MAGTICVACKMPNGLILRNFKMETRQVPVLGGGMRDEGFARQVGDSVTIRGNRVPFGEQHKGPMAGGYALTTVDADFWNAWYEANKDSDIVRNRVIFAHEKPEAAERKAREQGKVKSGLEPLDMSTVQRGGKTVTADERVPRPRPGVGGIEKADTAA
jgi:hypothetical protein